MRILIIASAYPKINNMVYAFIHARAKIYARKGHEVEVFVPSKHNSIYEIEKVHVTQGNIELYKTTPEAFDPDVVALHSLFYLANRNHLKILNKNKIPIVVRIHGSEALFHAFLSGYITPWDLKSKFHSVTHDPLKLISLRHLFVKSSDAIVFVSKWMKTVAERYLLFKHPFSTVIPNPIDTELFSFKRKIFRWHVKDLLLEI